MNLKTITIAAIPLLLLLMGTATATTNQAKAWEGGYPGPGPGILGGLASTLGYPGSGGFYAGQQDAVYDRQNNLAYNPVGSCLPCHSQTYWDNFRKGYDSVYQSQAQQSDQSTKVNIYGNNNYVNVGQSSNQGQGQDQQQGPSSEGLGPCGGQLQGCNEVGRMFATTMAENNK